MSSFPDQEAEKDALKALDKLPVLPKYEKEVTGLLAEEGLHCALLRVSGPGTRHISIHGVVTERNGQKRRFPLVKDPDYNDYVLIRNAPPALEGRYTNASKAFEAIDRWLAQNVAATEAGK